MRKKINISFLSLQSVFDVLVRRERADVLLCCKLAERDFILTCILTVYHSETERGIEGLLNLRTAVWVTDGVLIYLEHLAGGGLCVFSGFA